jgi:hypothetical protein
VIQKVSPLSQAQQLSQDRGVVANLGTGGGLRYSVEALEVHHVQQHLHQPVLSREVANAARASHPRPTSKRVCEWSMEKKNYWRNLAATIPAPVDHAGAFKNCCMKAGIFDGELRNYFFQRVMVKDGSHAVLRCSGPVPSNRQVIECTAPVYKIGFEAW